MNDLNECPICMDVIDMTKNCVTTECGHCFHAKCLMVSVSHSGFKCPYCRSIMAEEIPDDDDDNYTETTGTTLVQDEFMEQHVLRGLRFMTNNLEGLPHDEQDIQDEDEDEHEQEEQEQEEQENEARRPARPDVAFIAERLIAQGVTFETLLKCMMLEHEEYSDIHEFLHIEDDLFGKMRIIISNF